jgi:hypothetical protein
VSGAVDQGPAIQRFTAEDARQPITKTAPLVCGIGYGIAYVVANDVIAARMFDGYSRVAQAISELSGTEAPSRGFLTAMLPAFTLLVLGFGIGVWRAAGPGRALRATGALLIVHAVMFPLWLLFPMTSREELAAGGGGVNDVGHMVLSVMSLSLILGQMATSGVPLLHDRHRPLDAGVRRIRSNDRGGDGGRRRDALDGPG